MTVGTAAPTAALVRCPGHAPCGSRSAIARRLCNAVCSLRHCASGAATLCLTLALALPLPVRAGAFDDFFKAARTDDVSAMIALALRGFDLNTINDDGDHALQIAIRNDASQVVDFLLTQPAAQVERVNANGESPLMLAALKGQLALVQRLLERGAEVNKPGWAALHYAASHPEEAALGIARLLLERHAYIDAESPNGTTPLMMAARYGHQSVVRLLIDEGADLEARNEQGLTALDFARAAQRPDAVRLIETARQSR